MIVRKRLEFDDSSFTIEFLFFFFTRLRKNILSIENNQFVEGKL